MTLGLARSRIPIFRADNRRCFRQARAVTLCRPFLKRGLDRSRGILLDVAGATALPELGIRCLRPLCLSGRTLPCGHYTFAATFLVFACVTQGLIAM